MPENSNLRCKIPVLAAAVLLALAAGRPAAGDDRFTLRDSAGNPYVFVILDTSGSMNWAPPSCNLVLNPDGSIVKNSDGTDQCTPAPPCPSGDCFVPLQADDSGSKLFQAKRALNDVLKGQNAVHLGFATYNQDALNLHAKHWLYAVQAASHGPTIPSASFGFFPPAGAQEVFGFQFACNGGDGTGCTSSAAADLSSAWQTTRMYRLPKGGAAFSQVQTFWVKTNGNTYQVTYTPLLGPLGAPTIKETVAIGKCNNSMCGSVSGTVSAIVTYDLVQEFLSWDNYGGQKVDPQLGYFNQTAASDSTVNNASTCFGWDPNTDTAADQFNGYSIHQPTDSSDGRGAPFTIGDVIPWDWKTDHNLDVRKRLAPNLELNANATPDFTISDYFNNAPWSGESFLRIPTGNVKDTVTAKSLHAPLMAQGFTPIGGSLSSFQTWFNTWRPIASAKLTGDPLYTCSSKFVLFITDGDDTCNTNPADLKYPCTVAKSLNSGADPVKTFILGFGVPAPDPATGNFITCVAKEGGTIPIFPQDEAALTRALNDIFGAVNEKPTAFASAAVPSVQAETADKLFLTSFFPLNFDSTKPTENTQAGIWDGHVNAFLKPLPLTTLGTPDVMRTCNSTVLSSCFLWDAGAVLLNQAPTAADIAANNFKIGNAVDQRRVVYAYDNPTGDVPANIRTFTPPAGAPPSSDWADLWAGLKLTVDPTKLPQAVAATKQVIENLLEQKLAHISFKTVDTSGNPVVKSFTETYVLGDIFHSDPLFYSNPDNFLYYAADLYGNNKPCTDKPSDNPGYRCFAEKHRKRRKLLVVGANDGQLHAFDAGTWDATPPSPRKPGFNDGTGREVFSYIPRLTLPVVRDQAATDNHTEIFSVDGTVRIEDVFIDPRHTAATGPVAANREWRTVLIGGFREGGKSNDAVQTPGFISGFYALDVTDPDAVDTQNVPKTTSPVPGCIDTSSTASLNAAATGCGTNPFPAVLWEFTDSIAGAQLDEDLAATPGKGSPDLGSTWSVPTVGRIQVTESGKVVQKSVAIFGGGFDTGANGKTLNPQRGNWIYIVDIETGRAIYKQAVAGSVVGDPAVVDTDQNGLLDTVYFGTTAGFLYKMDISKAATLNDVILTPAQFYQPSFVTTQTTKRVTDIAWAPFQIFNTGGLPIYIAPTTFFVTSLNQYAVAFGTGDREDLWNRVKDASNNEIGFTFNLIVDQGFTAATLGLPKTAANYSQIGSKSAAVAVNSDFVNAPLAANNRGWIITLQPEERVITQAFGLAGVMVFSTYIPSPLAPDPADTSKCAFKGDSNNFVVFANNANPVAVVGGVPTRFSIVTGQFVTNPFIEQGATKNAPSTNKNSEQLDATQQGILQTLKKFYPKNTKFANYWISVSGVRSDTGYVRYATIPIGIVVKNWKEY